MLVLHWNYLDLPYGSFLKLLLHFGILRVMNQNTHVYFYCWNCLQICQDHGEWIQVSDADQWIYSAIFVKIEHINVVHTRNVSARFLVES
jgi:hypothetical protein